MSKVAVVYWSGTGNTEAMAEAVADGIREKGGEAVILTAGEFDRSMIEDYDSIALAVRPWVMRNWKKVNLLRCLSHASLILPERRSHFSVHMAGATVNGCVNGRKHARKPGPCFCL